MKKLNIWVIKIGDPILLTDDQRPWRSSYLARHLATSGHEVTLWNSNFNHYQKTFHNKETVEITPRENLKYILIKGLGYKRNVSIKRFVDHRVVAKKFAKIAENQKRPDIIISAVPCHNLAYASVKFAKKNNIPILVDVSDLWPHVFLTAFKNSLLKKIARIALMEEYRRLKYACRNATACVAISETYMDFAMKNGSRSRTEDDKIFHLGGIRIPTFSLDKLEYKDGVKEILYVGSFGKTYELQLMVKAARYFSENNIKDVRFVLIGAGEQEKDLKEEAEGLKNIEFTGWLNLNEIQERMQNAYLGVIPYKKGAPQCFPYKTFDYFSAGLPVISSLINTDMEYKIEEYQLGKTYQPGDADALIDYCKWIIEHPEERNRIAQRVYSFFEDQGDSEVIYEKYQLHIEEMAQKFN